jgi:Protein of unknown function (DUF3147)
MTQLVVRFLLGGTIVSLFALLGDVLRPKGFAGLFAAAPSVALTTLTLTIFAQGAAWASVEARSMIAGEVAFACYAVGCVYFLAVRHLRATPTSLVMLILWGAVAFGLYWAVLR